MMADLERAGGMSGGPVRGAALPAKAQRYIDEIIRGCGGSLASVIVFGSAATGGWSEKVSDVDLILVVPDGATAQSRRSLGEKVGRIEAEQGLAHGRSSDKRFLERILEKITATDRTFFVCARGDLLAGDIGRILGVRAAQAKFVDRGVLANICASGRTVWGEDLLSQVPVAPVRRLDVGKAFFAMINQALTNVALYPLAPHATEFAMGALKRSVHSCFFCYELRRASLEEEVRFFEQRMGPSRTLSRLVALRGQPERSFRFVAACVPAIARMHWRTAFDNHFPRPAVLHGEKAAPGVH